MSFLSALQANLRSAYDDERDAKAGIFGVPRRDDDADGERNDGDDDEFRGDVQRGRVAPHEVAPPASSNARRAGGLPRSAAVPRDSRQRLNDERAAAHALMQPSAEHRRELIALATARRESVESTITWMLSLARAHMQIEREERERPSSHNSSSSKQRDKKRSSQPTVAAAPAAAVAAPLSVPLVERLLLEKDEELARLKQQLASSEQAYLLAFSKLSIEAKRELIDAKTAASTAVVEPRTSSDDVKS